MLSHGPRGFGRLVQPVEDPALGNISWVAFDGNGAIRGHENVASITDAGSGDFTITWARAFATASSYAVALCSSVANPFTATSGHFDAIQAITAGTVRTSFLDYNSAAATDPTLIYLTAIGEH